MPSTHLFSETIAILEKSLNLRSKRHQVLSSNIANIDTPNYKAFDLVIEDALKKPPGHASSIKLVRTHASHFPVQPRSHDNVKIKLAEPPELPFEGTEIRWISIKQWAT
ncbi:MAG: flagellar basal body rod protein FlgB [Desulfobacterales bacterium]|nr:MAG: flagellar basal body rod protein FlgB [Desulfobacterales bacterium]